MPPLCDTHVVLYAFWAHEPERLSSAARQALELGRSQAELAIADTRQWEMALQLGAPLITEDASLRALEGLETLW
ncbi:hypothetical protein H6G65_00945 [Microcystis elabens FACHB-917]|nr:hypothetical protein [Microcystis elabens FACHB-917]